MAPIPTLVKPRLELHLRSGASFDDDLGIFGQTVGPRLGPAKRSQSDMEDWCVRRFLIALRRREPRRFPIVVTAYPPSETQRLPDFVIAFADGARLGLEVTEATSEEFQRELTESERAGSGVEFVASPGGDGFVGDAPERMLMDDISRAIERKAKKFSRKRYADTPICDLLIYENSKGSVLARDREQVLGRLAERWSRTAQPFHRVHLLYADVVRIDLFGSPTDVSVRGAYEHDFVQWLDIQAHAAREERRPALDLPNLAEELESLARNERRSLGSHLRNLLVHLLKWQHQPSRRSVSWMRSIFNSRQALEDLIATSPSLGAESFLNDVIRREYPRARTRAAREAGLTREALPSECPFGVAQIFDPDFPPADEEAQEG